MTASTAALGSNDANAEMSRREFLNYAWLATLGILTIEMSAVTLMFAMPRLGPGEFGGSVPIGNVDALPMDTQGSPTPYNRSKFWWVNTDAGALAIYKVCTHLGCIYDWKPAENKYICPCHGSQFERDGTFIQGPAPRNLDRFVIRALDGAGNEVARTNEAGAPLSIPPGSTIVVETGMRIHGQPKA